MTELPADMEAVVARLEVSASDPAPWPDLRALLKAYQEQRRVLEAASPVVPVGSGEPVARATCQDCGGHIEGWICQSCDRQFRENDAGDLVFEDQPVVPVGVSEVLDAAAAYLKEQYGASHGLDHPVDRARIIAALRPTDTGEGR